MFALKENLPGNPLLLHDEPIYLESEIIGRTTSGNYSFNFKKIYLLVILKIYLLLNLFKKQYILRLKKLSIKLRYL